MGLQWRDRRSPELRLQQPRSRQHYVHGKNAQCHRKAFIAPPIFPNYTGFLQAQGGSSSLMDVGHSPKDQK